MLFNELYGTYYNTMAKILSLAIDGNLTPDSLYNCIVEHAYSESIVPITDSIQKEKWQLLKFDREKNHYSTSIKYNPHMPLTTLQKQYLKAVLSDPRIRLFNIDFDGFEEKLADVAPLWKPEDYKVFDSYADGDDFENPEYKERFRIILNAWHNQKRLKFIITNRKGREVEVKGVPQKIEYSEKDNKFRVILEKHSRANTINLGRIVRLENIESQNNPTEDAENLPSNMDTIVFELTDERNALERVHMHFANLKKKTTKIGDNKYRVELEFNREDQTEMVIRLLQFGPMIKVLNPDYIVGEIVKRLAIQLRLLK